MWMIQMIQMIQIIQMIQMILLTIKHQHYLIFQYYLHIQLKCFMENNNKTKNINKMFKHYQTTLVFIFNYKMTLLIMKRIYKKVP